MVNTMQTQEKGEMALPCRPTRRRGALLSRCDVTLRLCVTRGGGGRGGSGLGVLVGQGCVT